MQLLETPGETIDALLQPVECSLVFLGVFRPIELLARGLEPVLDQRSQRRPDRFGKRRIGVKDATPRFDGGNRIVKAARRRGAGRAGLAAPDAPSAFSAAVRELKIVRRRPRPQADREPAPQAGVCPVFAGRAMEPRGAFFLYLGFDVGQASVQPRQPAERSLSVFSIRVATPAKARAAPASTRPAWSERRPSPVRAAPRVLREAFM